MFTTFIIPVSKDKMDGITTKQVMVSDHLLPIMAEIIECATNPFPLTATYDLRTAGHPLPEGALTDIRARVRYDLEHQIMSNAKEKNLAVITPVTIEELPDMGGVRYFASATAMRMLSAGLDAKGPR